MTDRQRAEPCPQCHCGTDVHSLSGLVALARSQPAPQYPGELAARQRYAAPARPRPGPARQSGWAAKPRASGAPEPQPGDGPGQPPAAWFSQGGEPVIRPARAGAPGSGIGDAVASVTMGAAARLLGRRFARRAQQTFTERVIPAAAEREEAMYREQDAIAERYPELRACLTDQVFFLPGGSRVLPMPRTGMLTLEQSDALVTHLRQP